MSRKHSAKKLANKRINYLYELAQKWLEQGRITDSQTAIKHLRKLAQTHVITINHINKTICKECNTLLTTSQTSTVRIHKNRVITTCKSCNAIKRTPYT